MANIIKELSVHRDKGYATIGTVLLRCKELTPEAMGLLTFMLTASPKFNFSVAGAARCFANTSEKKIRRIMGELKEKGYLTVEQDRTERGKWSETYYTVREEPQLLTDTAEENDK